MLRLLKANSKLLHFYIVDLSVGLVTTLFTTTVPDPWLFETDSDPRIRSIGQRILILWKSMFFMEGFGTLFATMFYQYLLNANSDKKIAEIWKWKKCNIFKEKMKNYYGRP